MAMLTKNDGEYFLSFYEFLMTNASEKILGFGATLTVQSIVSSASSPARTRFFWPRAAGSR